MPLPHAKMPTNFKASTPSTRSRSQNPKLNIKVGEWSGESRLEPQRRFARSRSCSSNSSHATSIASATKSKSQTSHNNACVPQRHYPRESVLDIRRRASAKEKTIVDDITLINAVKANYRFIYRINDGVGTVNTILQQVCEERGWREFQEVVPGAGKTSSYERAMRSATGWNLWWSYSIYQFSPYKYLRHWQFTNHNPKGFQFCNKLYLTMYLRKMKVIHGPIYDYYPLSFIVPEDYLRLSMEHTKRATESFTITSCNNLLDPADVPPTVYKPPENPAVIISRRLKPPLWNKHPPPTLSPSEIRFSPVWISKPVALSQGKGIFMTTDLTTIATDKKSVVQEYICRPLLIGGYKWDMRIYVCVAAIDPLVIYIYQEGLCRFCTEKYRTTDLTQLYSHLTNASLNKLSPEYDKDKELIGQGCKWPLRRLRQYFKDNGIADWYMWQRILCMVVLTVIGDSLRLGYSASNRNCFDLFGFDVMVDEEMKPWLLECNYSPGLGGDCETDEIVKRPMLHELFDLLGFPDCSNYSKPGTAVGSGSRPSTTISTKQQTNMESEYTMKSCSASGDNYNIPYDTKDQITRHYFELLMDKMRRANAAITGGHMGKHKWTSSCMFSPEARLMDAKSIYSQNLVVQYLKNQSQGKISNKVREQLITLAAKKLKCKLGAAGNGNKQDKKTKRNKSHSPVRVDSATQYDQQDLIAKEPEAKPRTKNAATSTKRRPKSAPGSASSSSSTTYTVTTSSMFGTLKKEFPHPDSEAFQKLKHYFDAGVDYPLDIKTGKFKECPALLTKRKDWFNPTQQHGGWIRVYPFDARTTKSPYKSSLTDIRQAVRSMESYLKTAEQVFNLNPDESDEYYRKKMKQTCRRDTEIWVPPLEDLSWANSQNNNFSAPVIISESDPDCSIAVDADASCTE